jgi:hypothetical protein
VTPDQRQQLEAALNDPDQAALHPKIRSVLQAERTHAPTEGAKQYDVKADTRTMDQGRTGLRDFNERLGAMGRGVKALGSSAMSPLETASSPEKVRQLVRGADDVFTLGYGRKAADALHANLPSGFPGNASAAGTRPFADTEARDAEVAPDYRTAGSLPAMFAPNPANVLFRGAGAVANKGFSRVPVNSALAGAPMGAAKSLVSYEATAPFAAGAHAESSGRRLEAAKEAAVDPLGIMLSGTLGSAGGAGRGHAARIRDPNTLSGRTIADVTAAGGRVKKFGEPVERGAFETPELKNLPEGRTGTHVLADRSVSRLEATNKGRLRAARQEFGDAVDEVIASHGDKPHPTTNAHKAIDAMDAENTINGVIGDEGVARATDKVRRMLTQQGVDMNEQATLANVMRKAGIPEGTRLKPQAMKALLAQVGPDDIVATSRQQVTAGDMVKARKIVRQLANNAPTPSENRVYQVILGAMDEDAVAIDPRVGQMNANFRKAMEPIEQSNSFLFNKADARMEASPGQREAAIGRLGRIGDDTQAGTKRDPALQRFEQVGPPEAQEALLMRAKKAQERLRRGEPQTSDAIDKTISRGPSYMGRTLGGVFGGPLGFMAGLAIDKYRQNPLANKVRLGLPASEAAGRLSGRSAVGVDEITGIARNRGKKKKKQEEATP